MVESSIFAGRHAARLYDRCLGPVIFAGMAAEMARRVALKRCRRVLETAAGTGIVTRALADISQGAIEIVATDLQADMLCLAKSKFHVEERVTFKEADAIALPFPDSTFDALVCQFGAMFFCDKIAAYREAGRVLTPGGYAFFSIWDDHSHNLFAGLAHQIVTSAFPDDTPSFLKVAYSYSTIELVEDLAVAGFRNIARSTIRQNRPLADAEQFARGMLLGNPTADQIRARGVNDPENLVQLLSSIYRAAFGQDANSMSIQASFVEASKPF